ncbi:MAG: hypothetical protein R3A47_10735 [Polyangiales bacterium]
MFPTALYEIAWVYINIGDATRAERSLEVLAIAAPSNPLIPDAQLLRGNLLMRNGCLDDAKKIFSDVHKEYGPVRMELDEIWSAIPICRRIFVRPSARTSTISTSIISPESALCRWGDA